MEPEIGANPAPFARENGGDPAHQERQDVEMPVETLGESGSVKRGSDAVADNDERARFFDTVPVKSASAPILGGSSSSADNLVDSSVATSVSVEDTVQTRVDISTSVGMQPASSSTFWIALLQ